MKKYIKPTCTFVAIKSMTMLTGSKEEKDPLDIVEDPDLYIEDGGA